MNNKFLLSLILTIGLCSTVSLAKADNPITPITVIRS